MTSSSPAAQTLAEFTAGLCFDTLPAPVRGCLQTLLIDYFRVASLGTGTPWLVKLREGLAAITGTGRASMLYSDDRVDAVRAAYLNGVIAGSLEWDDTHVGAMLHPGVTVWPAALAVGQMTGASGTEIIAAVAAGYEVMIRVGLSVQPTHFRRGFQSTATCGVFGAAAAAAKLLGLDATGIRNALGIAGSYAGGVTQFFLSGSEVKRLHAGKASSAGVEAALFAQAGLSGPPDVLEGRQGFAHALADAFDADAISAGLGEEFHILRLQMKAHAVSARVLAAAEAAEMLVGQGVSPDAIARVVIGVPQVIMGRLTNNTPADLQQAQMSSPFAVAMALALTPERPSPLVISVDDCAMALERSDIRDLSRRITCELDPEIEATSTTEFVSARVIVLLHDGTRREQIVLRPLGSPDRPMTIGDLRERFRVVTQGRVAAAELDAWIDTVEHPERNGWCETLMALRFRTPTP
jgi:2-methylcitrate dehydratase PrpD